MTLGWYFAFFCCKNHLCYAACFSYLKVAIENGSSSWKKRDFLHIELNIWYHNTWIRVTWLSISHTVTSRVLRSSSVNSFISCCWDCMYYEKGGMQWSKYKEDNSYWGEDMSLTFVWHALTCEILFLPREHKIHIFKLTSNVLFMISCYIDTLVSAFLTIFRRSPKITEDFRRRHEGVSMLHQQIKVQFKRQTWYQWNHGSLHYWGYGKCVTWVPDVVLYEFYEWHIFQYSCLRTLQIDNFDTR